MGPARDEVLLRLELAAGVDELRPGCSQLQRLRDRTSR